MNKKISLAIFLLLILPTFVNADTGPKPTVNIKILYENSQIQEEFHGILLGCSEDPRETIEINEYTCENVGQIACEKLLPLQTYDSEKNCNWQYAQLAWGNCNLQDCKFGYFPPNEFKLAIYVPSQDIIYITNEISRENFRSSYLADLKSDGTATISEITPFSKKDTIRSFTFALIITLISETLIALIFLLVVKKPKKILIWAIVGSLITLPIVWFIISRLQNPLAVTLVGFAFATAFEAYFICYINEKSLTLKQSFLLSALMNLGSVIIGFLVLTYSYMYGLNIY